MSMQEALIGLLSAFKNGEITMDKILEELVELPYKDLGFAKIDNHRELRQNQPETIYCQSKTPEQVKEIVQYMVKRTNNILATRASEDIFEAIKEICPEAQYHCLPRLIVIKRREYLRNKGTILVVSAGTSDLPVAQEAGITAEIMGNKVEYLTDVGVAGIHRLLDHLPRLRQANVLIVVAGMEGALASVVGGLVARPIVAVPTSIGYGANFQGLSALLSMLNSCAAGIGVVNIDNGFGAGRLAAMINEDGVNG